MIHSAENDFVSLFLPSPFLSFLPQRQQKFKSQAFGFTTELCPSHRLQYLILKTWNHHIDDKQNWIVSLVLFFEMVSNVA